MFREAPDVPLVGNRARIKKFGTSRVSLQQSSVVFGRAATTFGNSLTIESNSGSNSGRGFLYWQSDFVILVCVFPRSDAMHESIDRRGFLGAAAGGLVLGTTAIAAAQDRERPAARPASANETVVLAVMGVNGRGTDLARAITQVPNTRIACVADVDDRAIGKAKAAIAERQKPSVEGLGDFRKALDDRSVDALVIAAPNHWHAPATILACSADKHVYVEKPCCHNPREGELMVAAARKNNRIVQHGTQRRSWTGIQEAVARLRAGEIGRVLFARTWYNNKRPSIGHGNTAAVPQWLDYSLWQGPAPERPYRDNLIHYNWHWFWHWGNGELGNNGVHGIDVCRWGLGVDFPKRVASAGNKYRWDDDQETPDTHVVTFDFDGCSLVWEGRSWSPRGFENDTFGMSFYGDKGSLVVNGGGYKIYDMENRQVASGSGPGGDVVHMTNFVDCIRSGKPPNAEIEQGYKSALLCHLGNISHRVGRILEVDSADGHVKNDTQAAGLWAREYRQGWEPKV
jgi:predicted dehydrogenase